MTITIDDVEQILGISILGKTVIVPNFSCRDAIKLVVEKLEIAKEEVVNEIANNRGFILRMEWLWVNL